MAVGPDDELAGHDEPLLGQEHVADAGLADLVVELEVLLAGELAHELGLLGRGDVLVRHEVVGHEGDPPAVEDLRGADLLEHLDRDGGREIVGEGEIHLGLDEIAGGHALEPRVPGQNLFRNRHGHNRFSTHQCVTGCCPNYFLCAMGRDSETRS